MAGAAHLLRPVRGVGPADHGIPNDGPRPVLADAVPNDPTGLRPAVPRVPRASESLGGSGHGSDCCGLRHQRGGDAAAAAGAAGAPGSGAARQCGAGPGSAWGAEGSVRTPRTILVARAFSGGRLLV